MSSKKRFEELILKVDSSLSKIRESKLDSFMKKVILQNELSDIKNLIEKHSTLNEIDYYKETNDIPAIDGAVKDYEMRKMFEIVLELFALELVRK